MHGTAADGAYAEVSDTDGTRYAPKGFYSVMDSSGNMHVVDNAGYAAATDVDGYSELPLGQYDSLHPTYDMGASGNGYMTVTPCADAAQAGNASSYAVAWDPDYIPVAPRDGAKPGNPYAVVSHHVEGTAKHDSGYALATDRYSEGGYAYAPDIPYSIPPSFSGSGYDYASMPHGPRYDPATILDLERTDEA